MNKFIIIYKSTLGTAKTSSFSELDCGNNFVGCIVGVVRSKPEDLHCNNIGDCDGCSVETDTTCCVGCV